MTEPSLVKLIVVKKDSSTRELFLNINSRGWNVRTRTRKSQKEVLNVIRLPETAKFSELEEELKKLIE